jgi:hypothetical protein
MRYRTPLVVALATVALAVPVGAHGDEGSLEGFESTITGVEPSIPQVTVQVLDGDDELELTNSTGTTVTIFGYQKEPYLRFDSDGVYENQRSPAAFLNDDRFGTTAVPPDVSAKEEPLWKLATTGTTYSWHDHRIHWMSPIPPPVVSENEDEHHHVFDWRVEAQAGETPFAVLGSLDYEPPQDEETSSSLWLIVGVAIAAVVAAGALVLGLRHRKRPA